MGRGRTYTDVEDRFILELFRNETMSTVDLMTAYRERFPSYNRAYVNLRDRFGVLRRTGRADMLLGNRNRGRSTTTVVPHQSSSSSSGNDVFGSDSDSDSETEHDVTANPFYGQPQTSLLTQGFNRIKRRIEESANDAALDSIKYRVDDLVEQIAKRRRTIAEEEERRRKEEEEAEKRRQEEEARKQKEHEDKLNDTTKLDCMICLEEDCENCVMLTSCGHSMCVQCTTTLLTQPLTFYGARYHKCPYCRTELAGAKSITALPAGSTKGDAYKLLLSKEKSN